MDLQEPPEHFGTLHIQLSEAFRKAHLNLQNPIDGPWRWPVTIFYLLEEPMGGAKGPRGFRGPSSDPWGPGVFLKGVGGRGVSL